MTTDPFHHHLPEFSLNEAARIRARLLIAHDVVSCPRCGGELKVLGSQAAETELVLCRSCGAGVLMPLPAATVTG